MDKRSYCCQRCRNHGTNIARKGHADRCPYQKCPCQPCSLVEKRTDTHRLLNKNAAMVRQSASSARPMKRKRSEKPKSAGRQLRCAKCMNHKINVALKSHKKTCPYRDCGCSLCRLVEDYRDILKRQIKNRRLQKKEGLLQATPAKHTENKKPPSNNMSTAAKTHNTGHATVNVKHQQLARKSVIVSASQNGHAGTAGTVSNEYIQKQVENHIYIVPQFAQNDTLSEKPLWQLTLPLMYHLLPFDNHMLTAAPKYLKLPVAPADNSPSN